MGLLSISARSGIIINSHSLVVVGINGGSTIRIIGSIRIVDIIVIVIIHAVEIGVDIRISISVEIHACIAVAASDIGIGVDIMSGIRIDFFFVATNVTRLLV